MTGCLDNDYSKLIRTVNNSQPRVKLQSMLKKEDFLVGELNSERAWLNMVIQPTTMVNQL